MTNHFHTVLRTDPDRVASWSDEEVARRWLQLCPGQKRRLCKIAGSEEEAIRALARDRAQIAENRLRLSSLSWFNKMLKEPIARRANREDGVTGHFWDGRFNSFTLLDDGAVLLCMVYNDLNPIRAQMSSTLEGSDYTSIQDRILVRQGYEKLCGLRQRAPRRARALLNKLSPDQEPRHAEDGIWLIPIERRGSADSIEGASESGLFNLSLDDYLQLVDSAGRIVRGDKRGALPPQIAPILERLEVDVDRFVESVGGTSKWKGTAIGSAANLAREAVRRGTRWVVNACRVHCTARSGSPQPV